MDKANVHKFKATGLSRAMKLIMESEQVSGECQNIATLGEPISWYIPALTGLSEISGNCTLSVMRNSTYFWAFQALNFFSKIVPLKIMVHDICQSCKIWYNAKNVMQNFNTLLKTICPLKKYSTLQFFFNHHVNDNFLF